MSAVPVSKVIHVSFAGPILRITDVRGKTWRFENHPYFGPIIVDRHNEPKKVQLGENSPFWFAFESWVKQGSKLLTLWKDPVCDWKTPAQRKRGKN